MKELSNLGKCKQTFSARYHPISPNKLETKYNGPCSVIKVLDCDTYVISEQGKEVIEHHSRLKHFRPNEQLDTMDSYMNQYDLSTDGRHQGYVGYDPNLDHQPPSDEICPPGNTTAHDIDQNLQNEPHNDTMPDAAHTDEISQVAPHDTSDDTVITDNNELGRTGRLSRRRRLPSKYKDYIMDQ